MRPFCCPYDILFKQVSKTLIFQKTLGPMAKDNQPTTEVTAKSETTLLNRSECNIMRGFAIILIIIDNFAHCFKGVLMDNEYAYRWSSVLGFLDNLKHPDQLLFFNTISFYCPYGVMLFIFLSGYCLTLKYEKGNGRGTSCKEFISNHYSKLFTMQLKGLALFLTVYFLCFPEKVAGYSIVLQTFLVGNLNPKQFCTPGPYWFFGMIMEMYVIYRLIIYNRKDIVAIGLTVFSIVVMAFLNPEGKMMIYLRVNCFLAILPFCMGVLAARHLDYKSWNLNRGWICLGWFLLSFGLLTLSKFNFYSWLIMPVFIIATAVTVVKLITRVKLLVVAYSWLGAMSGVLFVVHPALRELLKIRINTTGTYYSMTIIYLLITFGLCMILKPAFSGKKKEK